ncbi:DUF2971 domain-containing protein [Tenacibaculum finnmarkense]|uniref:DUF2971 domain-containing protein n=1 Tax=Tenacibaculum finnmarkense TaxID=2781243 RepID=UPI001E385FC7|nr:DUF2971 domain-containing protein [Tenacibaculum finnmarkense]
MKYICVIITQNNAKNVGYERIIINGRLQNRASSTIPKRNRFCYRFVSDKQAQKDMKNKIDDIFNSDEIIYHYTKTQTVYEYILHTKKLRLSDRKTSNDPIESVIDRCIVKSFYGYLDTKKADNETADKVSKYILEKINNCKQLCFCKNNDNPELQKFMILPSEYYGFLKPRMWDQYGDKYNGVCLVFDKKILKENNPDTYSNDIEYINYEEFFRSNISIDLNNLYKIGLNEYCRDILEKIKNVSFLKHKDYSGENEYRFISFSNSETYLNIGNSLKAIIVSRKNLSNFADKRFIEFTTKNNIKLFYIKWDNSGYHIQSKEDYDKDLQMVSDLISRVKDN